MAASCWKLQPHPILRKQDEFLLQMMGNKRDDVSRLEIIRVMMGRTTVKKMALRMMAQ